MNKSWMFLLLLMSSASFADQFMCSTNMQYVSTGDTVQNVIDACGQPTQVVTQAGSAAGGGGNLIWLYQTGGANQAGVSKNGFTASAGQLASAAGVGTGPELRVTSNQLTIRANNNPPPVDLGIVFTNGQVSSIQQQSSAVNTGGGQSINSYTCPNGPVTIGASMSDVSTACGLPVFQKTMAQGPQQKAAQPASTLLIYQAQSYLPAQTFVFQGGILVGQR